MTTPDAPVFGEPSTGEAAVISAAEAALSEHPSLWRRAGGCALQVAHAAEHFVMGPSDPPEALSEHFHHADKRNDLMPDIKFYRA